MLIWCHCVIAMYQCATLRACEWWGWCCITYGYRY